MLVLGFDGGGSTARLAIADKNGSIVHYGSAGGVNPLDNPAWEAGLDAVFAGTGDLLPLVKQAVLGLPSYGEVREADQAMSAAVHRLAGPSAHLLNDVALAHYGAFSGGAGILVLSGTGSMAIAGGAELPLLRVGGWGDELGDEGSAFWIGRRALKVAAWMIDGRSESTAFLQALQDHLRIGDGDAQVGLMEWYYAQAHRRSAAAGLARFIDDLASRGDETALCILRNAAEHLALHLSTAERRLGGTDLPWTYSGGAFASRTLLSALEQRHGSAPVAPQGSPLAGSLLKAARLAEWRPDDRWQATVAAALAEKIKHHQTWSSP
jgi:N-acetylglucosamine kinase-like BadF-type ATPase